MTSTGHGGGVPAASWDGRARCRLCAGDLGADHGWCAAAEGLACDGCCEEVLGGDSSRLEHAAAVSSRDYAPLETMVACLACPRLDRMLVDDEDLEGPDHDARRLH
jgi:hypothetical protein